MPVPSPLAPCSHTQHSQWSVWPGRAPPTLAGGSSGLRATGRGLTPPWPPVALSQRVWFAEGLGGSSCPAGGGGGVEEEPSASQADLCPEGTPRYHVSPGGTKAILKDTLRKGSCWGGTTCGQRPWASFPPTRGSQAPGHTCGRAGPGGGGTGAVCPRAGDSPGRHSCSKLPRVGRRPRPSEPWPSPENGDK